MGPVSPSKLSVPLPTLPAADSDTYDVINESYADLESPKRTSTLPDSRRGKLSFSSTRSPSPKAEKKMLLRKRSGSFDSHTSLSTKHH